MDCSERKGELWPGPAPCPARGERASDMGAKGLCLSWSVLPGVVGVVGVEVFVCIGFDLTIAPITNS